MNLENHKQQDVCTHPIDWMRVEYIKRRGKNSSYSLRAYARHLGLAPGPLSEILSKKRQLSLKLARRIAERLSLTPEESELFLKPLHDEETVEKLVSDARIAEKVSYRELGADEYYVIADWYHYAILSLVETKDFQSQPKWIAKRLGISVVETRTALDRLERLGLIKRQSKKIVLNQRGVETPKKFPNSALRRAHRQHLDYAKACLEEVAVEDRDISFITMAVDPSKIPVAKKMIKKFRRKLAEFLESGECSEVYNLNIQFVPLTKLNSKGEKK